MTRRLAQTGGALLGIVAGWFLIVEAWAEFDSLVPVWLVALTAAVAAIRTGYVAIVSGDAGYGDEEWPWYAGLLCGTAMVTVPMAVFCTMFALGGFSIDSSF